jgi:predicted nucleic acid-binding protein
LNTIIIIASIITALFVVSRYLRKVKKHSAAMNALVAKATYQQLPVNLQTQVVNNTLLILQRDGGYSSDRAQERLKQMDEKIKYSFFALSMLELGIEPISQKWHWQIVSTPFVALIGAEREIEMARLGLKREGIEPNLVE